MLNTWKLAARARPGFFSAQQAVSLTTVPPVDGQASRAAHEKAVANLLLEANDKGLKGDFAAAISTFQTVVDMSRREQDGSGEAAALAGMGNACRGAGDYAAAGQWTDDHLATHEPLAPYPSSRAL